MGQVRLEGSRQPGNRGRGHLDGQHERVWVGEFEEVVPSVSGGLPQSVHGEFPTIAQRNSLPSLVLLEGVLEVERRLGSTVAATCPQSCQAAAL